MEASARRIFVAGATGYIGQQVVRELVGRGDQVVAFARRRAGVRRQLDEDGVRRALAGAEVRFGEVTDAPSLAQDGFRGEPFDAVVSCLASRTGAPEDAWRLEHDANQHLLACARAAGARHFVLLSAICVQKPRLAFQHAKLAFERSLIDSGLRYSIVRPTAFFKSLAGQVGRVQAGRPFLVFGDGTGTACKPISEADLARYLADCLDEPRRFDAVLPIGGPGERITPLDQVKLLSELLGRPVPVRRVPVWLLDVIIGVLSALGRVVPGLRDKAELARIGRYYATESMLVWDEAAQRYDSAATPAYGTETLRDCYARLLAGGQVGQELGDHAIFSSGPPAPRADDARARGG